MLLEWGEQKILLTGDIEGDIEARLLAEGLLPADVTLLVAPHHGSKTSSTRAFVAHTRAQAVVFSAGYRNRYRHPHPKIVERYRDYGTKIYNTGEQGAIIFEWRSADSVPTVERARYRIRRAWY